MNNGTTLHRVFAYMLDMFFVSMLTSLLTIWIPLSNNYKEAFESDNKLFDSYASGEISLQDYYDQTFQLRYTLEKETITSTIVGLVITVGYFATFAFYNKGQTFGKKIVHLRVVNEDGNDASHFQMIFRTILLHGTITSIISCGLLFLVSAIDYIIIYMISLIYSVFFLVCALMMVSRKDKKGLHDILARTRVVSLDL